MRRNNGEKRRRCVQDRRQPRWNAGLTVDDQSEGHSVVQDTNTKAGDDPGTAPGNLQAADPDHAPQDRASNRNP